MRRIPAILGTAILSAAAAAFAAEPAVVPAPSAPPAAAPGDAASSPPAAAVHKPETLSPNVQAAISELSSDDFKTREAALGKLEIALGEQMRALVSSDDPEVQARITSLLQFNDGLTRWVLDSYKLPDEQRKAMINFGLEPSVLPTLAKVFSADNDKRVEGIHELGKIDKPEATAMLGRFLSDPERAVYVAAMEAVWDRKADNVIVEALWNRAIEAPFAINSGMYRQTANNEKVTFRGHPLPAAVYQDMSFYRQQQDSNIACDVLVNIKAPQVAAKLQAFLENIQKGGDNNQNMNMFMYNSNSDPMKNMFRLIENYKTKEVVASLYKLAMGPVRQRQQGAANNEKYFFTNRTAALATFIVAIDQKPEDYKIKRSQMLGGMWSTPTEADEEAAVKAIKKWWAENGDKYGEKTAMKSATTQPATQPAAEVPADDVENANNNIAPRPIMRPPLMIRGQAGGIIIQGNANVQIAPAPAATAPADKK